MHAMRAHGQTVEEAERLMNNFIRQQVAEYKRLMAEGKTEEAYFALGMAMHPLMDNTSPSHFDYHEWHLIPLIDTAIHKWNETGSEFNSNSEYSRRAVEAIRRLYDEANR